MPFLLDIYNKRQQQVITSTDGPLLVISGAGTGKTHVLTGRILYLLLEKKVRADQILALTFTEKATQEMANRIQDALPLGHPEVCIKTFHAFCDKTLRERGFEIGLSTDYKVLSEVDLWIFLKRHYLDFNLRYYRSSGNPKKFLAAVQEYFSRLKDEDITPQQYLEYAKKLRAGAKNDEMRETAEKHLELANAYAIYEKLLKENDYMDYGGLLANMLRLFGERKSVLAEYQDCFKYILVDEFQDTNFAQNKIVTLLAEKHRNLMVVGDDDQSIYKWRGASLTNIQYFQKTFPGAGKIVLNENYRNSQTLLDLSYHVIQKNNPNRLEVTESVNKRLVAAVPHKHKIPEIHHFDSFRAEIEFVLEKASNALQKGMDTAILPRTNALARHFLEKLQYENASGEKIPFQHFSESSLLAKPAVKDCIAVLRVLANPWDNVALYRLLSFPLWNIPMEELLKLTARAKSENLPIFDFMNNKYFMPVKKLISTLIEFSREQTVSTVLGKFLKESGYITAGLTVQGNILGDLALFSEKIASFEDIHPYKSISDFLEFFQLLEEVGESRIKEEVFDANSLKIITVHSAKGLEFDAVFVPGLAQGKFPTTSRKDSFEVPQELIPELLPIGDHHLEEERRLFYVACTRARELLVFSYSDFYDGKKQWKPSVFIGEALESGKTVQITGPFLREREHKPLFRDKKKNAFSAPAKFSYSQFDAFKTCPFKYQLRYLKNIPTPTPGILNFGTSLHNMLRVFYEFIQKNPHKREENLSRFLEEIYEKNWIPYGYESRAMQEDQKKIGHEILKRYYLKEKNHITIPAFLEKSFSLKIGNVVLAGRIDRIDKLNDGTYEVIDYKTGESKQTNLRKDLQLSIYALACRDALTIPVSRLSLYFLGDLKKISTTRTDADLENCKQQILEHAKKIAASDFSPAPGYHCSYCDFRLICPVAAPMVR